jgi:hypothetical protein
MVSRYLRLARRYGHLSAQHVELQPLLVSDKGDEFSLQRRNLLGTVHAEDAKLQRFRLLAHRADVWPEGNRILRQPIELTDTTTG